MFRFSYVAVGGTFDRLHEGHKALLRKAFQVGKNVIVGVATNELLVGKANKELIYPYARRVEEITQFLASEGFLRRAEIIPIRDSFGTTTDDPRIQAVVVSEETAPVVRKINIVRRSKGLHSLRPVIINMVLDSSGQPIRSTKLREMDKKRGPN